MEVRNLLKLQNERVIEYPNSVSSEIEVSIIVLTYNHKYYIGDCLENILSQKTKFNFEIIIGEDDSEDGTREICLKYAKKYPDKIRLFLHSKENNIFLNGHPTGRFNYFYNFSKTKGIYIAVCDGDDYWIDKTKLQRQVDFMESNPDYVIHHTSFKEFYNNQLYSNKESNFKKESNFSDLIKSNYIVNSSVLYRKAVLPNVLPDWFEKVFVGDWSLFLILTRNGGKIFYDETPSVVYRKNVGIYKNYKNHILNLKKILELKNFLLDDPLFQNQENLIKISIKETKMNIMAAYVKNGDYFSSLSVFARLFFKDPQKAIRIYAYSFKQRLKSN